MDYGLRFSDPAKYVRALRRTHELVISGVQRPEIPVPLAESWRRSMALGITRTSTARGTCTIRPRWPSCGGSTGCSG